jgi:hypothetical protein
LHKYTLAISTTKFTVLLLNDTLLIFTTKFTVPLLNDTLPISTTKFTVPLLNDTLPISTTKFTVPLLNDTLPISTTKLAEFHLGVAAQKCYSRRGFPRGFHSLPLTVGACLRYFSLSSLLSNDFIFL